MTGSWVHLVTLDLRERERERESIKLRSWTLHYLYLWVLSFFSNTLTSFLSLLLSPSSISCLSPCLPLPCWSSNSYLIFLQFSIAPTLNSLLFFPSSSSFSLYLFHIPLLANLCHLFSPFLPLLPLPSLPGDQSLLGGVTMLNVTSQNRFTFSLAEIRLRFVIGTGLV